ncbi:hypothetical protein [Nannocystis bainbridge]|uniref:Uncharacterized protein n=1 Tax=Nannocystis bainbridge TaxID=2995303 RepID=A0ABT5DZV2_9BACT|nr:hypothetical protein [Nannocystis bainbridge]MDC0719115.1 hypothetical protein [Nannocystis bainbridge]
MAHEPSRPSPAPSAELLRLAEEGAHNLQRADQDQQAVAERHLRVALGAHYGSDRKRGNYLPIVAGGGLISTRSS